MSRWRNSLGQLRTAKSKNPAQLQRTTWLYRGFFFLADENERFLNTSWRQQFCPCEKLFNELKILTWAVPNSARVNTSHEKPSGWPRSFWRLTWTFLSRALKLTSNQHRTSSSKYQGSQSKGTLTEFFSRVLWLKVCVTSGMIKILRSIHFSSGWLKLETLFKLSGQVCISFTLYTFLEFYMFVIFVQETRLLGFQTLHSTKFTSGAYVSWFPTCCCFLPYQLPVVL